MSDKGTQNQFDDTKNEVNNINSPFSIYNSFDDNMSKLYTNVNIRHIGSKNS